MRTQAVAGTRGIAGIVLVSVGTAGALRAQDGADAGQATAVGSAERVVAGDVPHTDARIEVDGILDEPLWQDALLIELDVETNPRENEPAPVQTFAYLIENGTHFFVAFDARDPAPEEIRAYLRDRDSAFNDDFVGIVLDTFNDQRRASEFFVNPLGVQMDMTLDDVNGGESAAWDAIWESAGNITESGYAVEIAIPFHQLRFRRSDGPQLWGIEPLRFYPRQDRVRMSSKPRDRGRNCYLCQIDQYRGFSTAAPGRGLEVVPSLTALRHDRRDSTPGPAVGGLVDGDTDSDVGVNVRWAVTPDLVANLALNPDFSQVEADVAQLDVNNQFALFFQETRPFFLEAAEFFSTPINAVFTRTVADPDIGAKVTGTLGANTFGVFAAEDKVTNLIAPGSLGSASDSLLQSSRTMVSRYRRNIGESSTIGALVTSRSGDGYDNTVAGIDGRIRAKDRHSFIFQLLHSDTEYPTSSIDGFDAPLGRFGGDAIQVNYDYGTRNWAGFANYERYDPQFRADSGFITQVDYERQVIGFRRTWHGDGSRWWDQIRTGGNTSSTYDLSGQLLGRWREIFFGFQGPLQSFSQMGVTHGKQFWNGTVYETRDRWMFGQIRPVSGLQIQANLQSGDQIDFANSRLGKNIRFSPQINWNANRHLLLGLQYTKSQLDDRTGSSIFDAELIDLRMTWQFNVRSFLRLTMQQQDVSRNVAGFLDPTTEARSKSRGAQLLYSYELNPQTVIFAGYSDNHLQNSQFADLTKTDRTFFLKLSYAWLPK